MIRRRLWIAVVALAGGVSVAAWTLTEPDGRHVSAAGLQGSVERGAYVARLSGCIGCHTDSSGNGPVLAGGAPIRTEFGTFRAPNITPHPEDGIGNWTFDQFATALVRGRNPQGHAYYPVFPYPFYSSLTDQDIVDLWAAVRSVPAVAGRPDGHDLSLPFRFRFGLDFWQRLYFAPDDLDPEPGKTESWNRGRYLARAAAHCGACHTPRNILGDRDESRELAGGDGPDGEKSPDIRGSALESRGWSREDTLYALRTGITPKGDLFGGAMREVVRDGTRFWSDADLAALVDYIYEPETDR